MNDEPRDPFAAAATRRQALAGKTIGGELLPADPDVDDLPDELRRHRGKFFIDNVEVAREHLAAAFADTRRLADDDEA